MTKKGRSAEEVIFKYLKGKGVDSVWEQWTIIVELSKDDCK